MLRTEQYACRHYLSCQPATFNLGQPYQLKEKDLFQGLLLVADARMKPRPSDSADALSNGIHYNGSVICSSRHRTPFVRLPKL